MVGDTPMCSYVYFLTAFLSSYMPWDHRHCSRQQHYIMEPLETNYCWRLLCSKYLAMKTRQSKPHFPHRYVSIYFYIFYDFLCFTWDWPNFHTTVHSCTENHQQATHVSKQQWAMRTGAEKKTLLLWSRILTVCNNRPMLYCYQQSLRCSITTLGAVARMSCQKPRLLSESSESRNVEAFLKLSVNASFGPASSEASAWSDPWNHTQSHSPSQSPQTQCRSLPSLV